MISRKILWLENEPHYWELYADYLRMNGHEVRMATRVSEAESLLGSGAFNLLILDVMIPTWDKEEEKRYPPELTNQGRLTGLLFYQRMQQDPDLKKVPVLVYTIRRDTQLFEAFKREGLPEACFATKIEYRDPPALLRKVEEIGRSS